LNKSLQRLLETTTQRYGTIWSIYVLHCSVLTQIKQDRKWVHLT